jgi:cell division protein FtsI/penicillin-binding protein 2
VDAHAARESSFGQGEVLVTPLQAAVMFSAFANGGSIEAPILSMVSNRTEGTDYTAATEHEASVWKQNIVKPDTVNTIVPCGGRYLHGHRQLAEP